MQNELIPLVQPDSGCTKNIPTSDISGNECGHPYVPRVNLGGNFCGHYPDSPTLTTLIAIPDKLPSVLVKFCERVDLYYSNPDVLRPLNASNLSKKQQSSARREACILLLKSIALNSELSTMRCGIPTTEGFAPLTVNVLAKRAGLSISRAKRAMQCLKRASLIAVTIIADRDDLTGKYKGVPAIKRLNDIVFSFFGLGEMLKRARKAAYKRLQENFGKNIKTSVRDILGVKLLLSGSANSKKKVKEVAYPQNRTALFKQLAIDNPHLSTEEIFNMIKTGATGF